MHLASNGVKCYAESQIWKKNPQKKLLSFHKQTNMVSNELYSSQKVKNIIIYNTEVSLVQGEASNYVQFLKRPVEQVT